MIELREHQVEAKRRIVRAGVVSARTAPAGRGARATVVSATGSGKTYTAASAALDLYRHGRILVMVPTLELLVQTAESWRRVGHTASMVAVCSIEKDEVLDRLGVRTTTNPIQLALWAGTGPVVVLATYASLVDREDPSEPSGRVRGPLETALAGGPAMYGQQLAPFDLVVIDEAHGTAGDLGKPWAAIHNNARIPADFRLYLTATPRILAPARPARGRDGEEVTLATMASDPDGVYGERIYELGLSEAVERGVLAPFEIDVLEIEDPDFSVGLSEEAMRGRRLALLQAALLEHAALLNLRTVLTFHQQVEEAKAFAANLPDTASDLHDTQVSERALAEADARPASSIRAEPAGLEDLEAGRHVPADRVWADWLCGDHPIAHRREVLRQFANGIDAAGHRVHRAFLASVKVLGEGVDIVGERGVEAVCIVGARGSMVQIVQNIGRGLRPNPDGTAKTCRIIVPVFLTPGEDPTNMVASASFQPLVDILQGLRSHDERIVEQLASRALTSRPREKKHHVTSTGAFSDEDETAEPGPVSVMMNFASPRDPSTIAAFVRTRVIRPDATVWLEGWQALRTWRAAQGITGRHAVPYETTVTVNGSPFNLGSWIHEQRRTYRAGLLDEHRRELLDEAGMVWEPGDEAWEKKLSALRSFHRAHGHLAPRQDAVWEDTESGESELVPVGQHMANLRRTGGLGKSTDRAEQRAAQLGWIDPEWNCPWPLDWQRHYKVLADLVDADGMLPVIEPGVLFEGDDLGKWIARQSRDWALLSEEQQQRVERLGIEPAPKPSPTPAVRAETKRPVTAAFQRGLSALAQYIAREGTTTVRRPHRETIVIDGREHELALGIWYANQKQRRDKLTEPQRDALAELGVEWA
ncbi:Helicase associated domain protein [Streptomyces sp. NPDC006475]|uniref:DEAD/DEAH box helicase n=1 Tax=Streptomyces sp. NPDC006475 TaxID=3155719 RepID=UPI0033A6C8D8